MASSTLQSETLTDFDQGMLKTIMAIHDWDRNYTAIYEIFRRCEPSPAVAHAYWLALKPGIHGSVKLPDGETWRYRPVWGLALYLASRYRQRDVLFSVTTRLGMASSRPDQCAEEIEALRALRPAD